MQKRIPKPFTLFLFFFFLGNYLSASPDCPIVAARFQLADGTTSNPSATGWYLNATNVASTGIFWVKSNRLHAQELGGEGIWYSRVFSNPGYSEFQVAIKVSSEGDMNSSEYVKIYYKINGGAEVLLDQRTGNFGTIDFISPVLTGSNVQLVVKLYNYNNGGSQTSKYYIEEYRMFKEKGPCTVSSGITVTAAAANGGVLTCASPSLGLSATATGTGTTTWAWTGPNGYTSAAQNPTITTAGTYTVVATNSTGTGSASVTVTENKTAPVITATGGALACGSCVSISATSNVGNATYSWSGPGSFTSTSQNPTVCAAGTYTVTVTNPANGCSAQQSVNVTAGTISTIWLEDFTGLANGTTSDAGSTAWSTTVTGSGTYSVQNNEFKVSFSGSQGVGIWTSQTIDISSKTNVSFSVDLRSELAGTSDAFENADYIKVYYKLNGGAETLVYEDLAGIGSTTNTTGSITFNSATLSGSTLQVIIKASNSDPTERYFFDNIKVSGSNAGTTTVTPSVTGTVTCIANAQLSATASSTVSAWLWTGPNGFTSTTQNPSVSAGGQYVVTATLASGCSASGTITVAENKTPPAITASGGALGCLPTVTLNVSSSTSGATYSWTGPNGFTSFAQNPAVSTAGTYTATVTNPANGCTASQAVTVTSGSSAPAAFWMEDFSGLANGTTSDADATAWTATTSGSGTYSVQNNEFKTSFSAQAEGVWTSQQLSIAGKTGVTFSVDLRSETASTNDSFEDADYIRVYYKLNGGAETLVYQDISGIGNTTNTTASITVTSPSLSGSTLQVIIKTSNSGPTERYYFDNIIVTGTTSQSESATASATGMLTCTNTSVSLLGSGTAGGVSYSWTGPNGYTSTIQNPVVTTPGIYTFTVQNPSTGCSGTDTALVSQNVTAPGASASASGPLTCNTGSSVTLSGSSATSGVSYSWTGPNNFTFTSQNPVVTTAGTYNLTVTNPVNGCTSTAGATVTTSNTITGIAWNEDFTLPNGTSTDAGATPWTVSVNPSTTLFSVLNNEFRISNSSTTGEGVWTSGAIDITGKTNISISAGVRSSIINNAVMNTDATYGDYIRFYYKLDNGAEVKFAEKTGIINNHSTTPTPVSITGLSGAGTLRIVVRARATGNDEFYYFDNVQVVATGAANIAANATGGAINCINNSVALQGSSATSGVSYAWSGPNGFSSTVQHPVVTTPGNYTLTVALGSCTANAIATVTQDTTHPVITASANPLQLTCTATPSILTANSTTPGVNYSWRNSAGIIIASTASTSVTAPGNYTLTVTNPVNGCSSGSLIIVTQDTIAPTGITASHTGIITCLNPGISIAATVSSTGMNYSWTGPNGFTASTLNASVTKGGTYIFTATNPTNGCAATASTIVEENTTPPGEISINNSGTINCLTGSVTISGTSSSSGVNYKWTSPNGFSSSSATATVMHGGLYTLTATNPVNGCTSSKSTTVNENTTPPSITISNNSPISCATPVVTLSVVTNATNASYLWLGDDLISDAPVVTTTTAGLYILTVTDQINGCSTQELVEVTEDYSDCGARKATTTATNSATQNAPAEVTSFTYKAYPNPVITNGVIEFTSPQSATATVSIYNALGACEKVLFKGTVMANRVNRVPVPATQLAAGAYYYIINSGGKSFTGKLVIVK